MPLVRPVTVQGFERPHANGVCATKPTKGVTVYPLIDAPPSASGAVHETIDRPFALEVAATPAGAPGTVLGTTDGDAPDATEVPATFVAVTANVYAMPLVSPVMTQVVAPEVVHVFEPGAEVTTYRMIVAPPSDAGAIHVIVERVDSAPLAATAVGAVGAVAGVAMFDADDAALVPALFVAVTVNV